MSSSFSSSNDNSSSRDLVNIPSRFLNNPPNSKAHLEHPLQTKLFKYRTKLTHYEALMDSFYHFVSGILAPNAILLNSNRNTEVALQSYSPQISGMS
jgi:hypothetical protein